MTYQKLTDEFDALFGGRFIALVGNRNYITLRDKIINWKIDSSQLEAQGSEILADFENLLIEIMSNRKCSIGSIDNYYDLHLEVKKINELYSKLQYYHIVSQKSR